MLSECFNRVQKDDFSFDQKITVHPSFSDYKLTGDVYHEAGFDALATGVAWYKIMTYLGRERKFPGIKKIQENNMFKTLDKNRIPMSSIRTSMNLE